MKKYIYVLVAFIACLMFNSCNELSKSEIQTAIGSSVKNVKVEKLHLNNEFFKYHENCIQMNDSLWAVINLGKNYAEDANSDLEIARIWVGFDNKRAAKFRDSAKEKLEKSKTFSEKADALLKVRDKMYNAHKSGDIFVARYTAKNEYGKWENHNKYTVFTRNDKNELYWYDGEDAMKIVFSAFPKAKDEIMKLLPTAVLENLSSM